MFQYKNAPFNQVFNYARLIGFDFIKDINGTFWLVEVNDTPSYLLDSKKIMDGLNSQTLVYPYEYAVDKIASVLAGTKNDGVAVILRPQNHHADEDEDEDEDEFHCDSDYIIKKVKSLGRECIVASPGDLDPFDGLMLHDGRKIASVYRRTHLRADCAPSLSTINPAVSGYICKDKFITHNLFSDAIFIKPIKTSLTPVFDELYLKTEYLIRKPRFGSASNNVFRFARDQIEGSPPDDGNVWQPWIEPDIVYMNGKGYYYDIRVISFDGELVGAYARCAVAPVGGIAKNTTLEWLTTTGRKLPICLNYHPDSNSIIGLTEEELLLIKNSIINFSVLLENKITSYSTESINNFFCISPEERTHPILYVSEPDHLNQAVLSNEIIKTVAILNPKPLIYNINSIAGDWDELASISGWDLMPQLFVGNEYFVGSRVIKEAVQSGEVHRALMQKHKPFFITENIGKFILLPDKEHEGDVWAISSTPAGEVQVSAAADGTIRIVNNHQVTLYKIDTSWINSISISPNGQHVAVGTSKAEVFYFSLSQGGIKNIKKLIGHPRWVNGVIAFDNQRVLSASSDGTISLWTNGGFEFSRFRKCFGGHILGMRRGSSVDSVLIWSSDGLISLIDSKNLLALREWRPNTKYYVTSACEALIQNRLGFYAIDIKGNLYSSTVSHTVLNINERVWGMISNNFLQEILFVTINGSIIKWRGGSEIYIVKNFGNDSPTSCYHITHRNKLLVGFSSGKIELC
ncbi:TPA: hypothetical protein PXN54_002376 [Yersinia enterocolitica]|nr:hypothetical protein [Yersinia enterocolitica]